MSKKKTTKKPASRPKLLWVALPVAAVLLVGILLAIIWRPTGEPTVPTIKIEDLEDFEDKEFKDLKIEMIGNYSGLFVEDGSNDVVSHILMIVVKNTGTSTVQYAEIELTDGKKTASFTLSTLPPGESVVLLEKNRMPFDDGKDLSESKIQNVAVFQQEPTLCEDQLKIQAMNGVLNVTNISDEDIAGDIVIYYKNASSDLLYGGITYRVTIKGGIKAGEIKQITASHYTADGSRVMWVTVS